MPLLPSKLPTPELHPIARHHRRALEPHHVSAHELTGWGAVPCVELYQQKTSERVLIPLPPLAAAIWQRYGGQLPLPTQ